MSCGNHEISDYIDDLPMKISSSYMPKYFNIEIQEILSINENEDEYDFKIEKEAIDMARIAEEEKMKETESLVESKKLKDLNKIKSFDANQPVDQTSSPIVPGSPCIPMLPTVPINGIVSSLPSQPVLTNTIASPVPQPPTVSNPMPAPSPLQLNLPIHGSIPPPPQPASVPVLHPSYSIANMPRMNVNSNSSNVVNSSTANMSNVAKRSQGSSLVASSSSSFSITIPVSCSNFVTQSDVRYNNSKEMDLNSVKCNNDVNNVVIARRNSVPTSLSTIQDNYGILRPVPSQIRCDSSKSNDTNSSSKQQQEFIPKTRINPADFESSSSSPFDDALLRAIDDKQELNHVFQHY